MTDAQAKELTRVMQCRFILCYKSEGVWKTVERTDNFRAALLHFKSLDIHHSYEPMIVDIVRKLRVFNKISGHFHVLLPTDFPTDLLDRRTWR